ncbi:aldehyde dehydrogenase family protein [Actinomadura violacea]|uniref:Aldehyde dehydrogenase family protein n=1 Tax=Actinomadura violacea TaxID=2819934 RepID=A0ABS3S6S5_9ACTN|nr:aldehyde dehydrogenase family protein [Actinomadura violacea]MBO2463959.1 aldehyde dehydrogenase family protein [Actinomadura violacea]
MTQTTTGVTTIDPTSGEPLAHHPHTTPDRLEAVLAGAVAAGRRMRAESAGDRADGLHAIATRLRRDADVHAALITAEMGKPIDQARAEILKCATACDHYAGRLPDLLAPRPVALGGDGGHVRAVPLGTVLAVMPWNYPFWQVFRSMVPAIAIGNTVVLKHADNVTASALAIQPLFDELLGPGVLSAVVLPPGRIGPLIDDPRIAAVAFTGSNRVGAIVAARAGAAVKKTLLELGGSDPFVVLADADVAAAARAAVRSRFLNNGQSCIAAKRLIVERSVRDEFVDVFTTEMDALTVGDPAVPGTDIGPMARHDLRDELRRQLEATLGEGGRLLAGGARDERPGAWFPPALVEVDDPAATAFQQETFGPLGALCTVESADAAVEVANASRYGLSCSVWSADAERAQAVADRIETGSAFINRISESDPRLPVGGVKGSGHGRELGDHGALELANLRSVRITP